MWICYTRGTPLGESSCPHECQKVRARPVGAAVRGCKAVIHYMLLQSLVDEEADHRLRDACIRCSQSAVETTDALGFVHITCTLQGVHLLLSSSPGRGVGGTVT